MRTLFVLATSLAIATPAAAQSAFTLTSPDMKAGGTVPVANSFNAMGCIGKNVSPALNWAHAPAGTKSFAVTVYDPDAPTGSGWWHWMVYDIPATTNAIASGAHVGVEGPTDFGAKGYGGPCPPVGDKAHRYIFTLYALKVAKLELPPNATSAMVGYNLHANQLAKATLTATFKR